MRLSEWRKRAPFKESMSLKVMDVVDEALGALGAALDPECWVAWGDDPKVRYVALVPIPAGLLQIHVRVNVPGEGPRASGKLARWGRVQTGEFGVEIQGGHRLVTFQVEGLVLTGADDQADRIGAFAQSIFAAIDGRAVPAARPMPKRRAPARASAKATPRSGPKATAKPLAKSAAKPGAKPAGATLRLSGPKGPAR